MYFASLVIFSVAIFDCRAAYYDRYDYCKLPCQMGQGNEPHMICKRGTCKADKRCKEFEEVKLTPEYKQLIIDEHNKYRNQVASGQERRGSNGPQPQAANMNALKYSDDLGHVAQCWANTCQPTTHSTCNRGKKMTIAMQNLAMTGNTDKDKIYNNAHLKKHIQNLTSLWYDEVSSFNTKQIHSYYFVKGVGHYSCMMWGENEEIGCGIVRFKDGRMYTIAMVCNYGTTGFPANLSKGQMYKVGKPCTSCPKDLRPNSKYKSLCGTDGLDLTRN